MSKFKDLTGMRFGRLVAIERAQSTYAETNWLCLCDCGNKTVVRRGHLMKGRIKSCGCIKREMYATRSISLALPNGQASKNMALAHTKRGAARRGYEWKLSDEFFFELIQKNCFYCGAKPFTAFCSSPRTGLFYFNGIDRVDNSIGYLPGNVVPCCKHCNMAKSTNSVDEFLDWVQRVHQHSVLGRMEKNGE